MTKKSEIENNLKELDKIIAKFEEGKVGLNDGIVEYENASKLIKKIKSELEKTELKINKIRDSID